MYKYTSLNFVPVSVPEKKRSMNSREAAFLSLLHALKGEGYISDFLEKWLAQENPSPQDYHLAQQIAYGSSQMALSLDYLALQVSDKKKVHLKTKERALFHTAIYQICFLDRIPAYAVVDETIKIAKKHFHKFFVSFLNATLRKLAQNKPSLPNSEDATSLSIRYSHPVEYVTDLLKYFGPLVAMDILKASNTPSITMARVKKQNSLLDSLPYVQSDPLPVVEVPSSNLLEIAKSPDFYIQNVTPAFLIGTLCSKLNKKPQRVLDMCASPGGKSLAVHDFFPDSQLFANDISKEKVEKLQENFEKYGANASLSCSEGQNLNFDEKFDLIILDVPCSNTGVLNKRPEARWRLTTDHYRQLENLQLSLVEQAIKLLSSTGELWYMTCSILPQENEERVAHICKLKGLKITNSLFVLPNDKGWDGGYACSMKKS